MTAQGRRQTKTRRRALSPGKLLFVITALLSAAFLTQSGATLKLAHNHFEHGDRLAAADSQVGWVDCGHGCKHPPSHPADGEEPGDDEEREDDEDCSTCTVLDHAVTALAEHDGAPAIDAFTPMGVERTQRSAHTRLDRTRVTRGPPIA